MFRLPDGYVCEDLQWDKERVSKGFAELLVNGFANRCETTKWVVINKHLEWNPPENPNQRKSVQKIASQVPDACCWKRKIFNENNELATLLEVQPSNPSETLGQPFLNQEQEQYQEQYQEQDKEIHRARRVDVPKKSEVDVSDVDPATWKDFQTLRKAKHAPVTQTAINGIRREAEKAGMTLDAAIRVCCTRGWTGFKAEWVQGSSPPARRDANAESFSERDERLARERVAAFAPGVAAKPRGQSVPSSALSGMVYDVTSRVLGPSMLSGGAAA